MREPVFTEPVLAGDGAPVEGSEGGARGAGRLGVGWTKPTLGTAPANAVGDVGAPAAGPNMPVGVPAAGTPATGTPSGAGPAPPEPMPEAPEGSLALARRASTVLGCWPLNKLGPEY